MTAIPDFIYFISNIVKGNQVTVQFVDTSSLLPPGYQGATWNFGGGDVITTPTRYPTRTYTSGSLHAVQMTADGQSVSKQFVARSLEADRYSLRLDSDFDLTFPTDLSNRLVAATWTLGIGNPEQRMASPTRCTLTIFDPDRDFSRDGGRPPFNRPLVGCAMRLEGVWVGEGVPIQMLQMWITDIQSPEDEYATYTTITLADKLTDLRNIEYYPQFNQDVPPTDEIKAIFAQEPAPVYWVYDREGWVLGVATLGVNTYLKGSNADIIDDVSTTYPWLGDAADRGKGVSPIGYISDLITPLAGGRFIVQRDGRFRYQSRNSDAIAYDKRELFDACEIVDYTADQSTVYNRIAVNYYPRVIGLAGSVIWTEDNVPFDVNAGQTRNIRARFFDPDLTIQTISALEVYPLDESLDYAVSSFENLEIRITESDASSAQIVIQNNNPTEPPPGVDPREWEPLDFEFTKLQIRGDPVKIYHSNVVELQDADSIFQYGLKPMNPLDLRFVDKQEDAQFVAEIYMERFKSQINRYTSITFELDPCTTDPLVDLFAGRVLRHTIGDVINFTNAVTGHDQDYVIIREQHALQAGSHRVTWGLRVLEVTDVWILNNGILGLETYLSV